MPEGPVQAVPPYPLAMIICDQVHRDPGTGKAYILGCFSVIGARQFPATHGLLSIYIAITDGRGKVPVRLRLVDADEQQPPLFDAVQEVQFKDPRDVAELVFHLRNLKLPGAGEYRFQLFAAEQFLMERKIVVHKRP